MFKRKLNNKHKIAINIFFFGIGILLFCFIIHISGEAFFALLKKAINIKYYYLLTIFAVTHVQLILVSKRWAIILGCYTDIKSLPKGFIYYNTSMGLLMSLCLPIFGYMGTKTILCKIEHNISVSKTVYATSLEHIIGFSVILSMLMPSVLYISNILGVTSGLIVTIIIIIGLFIGFSRYYKITLNALSLFLLSIIKKLNKIFFIKNKIDEKQFNPSSFHSIDKRSSTKLVCLSLLMYYIVLVKCYIYLKAFNIDVNMIEFMFVYPIGYFLSTLGLTPGNLGIADLGWFSVLTITGASRNYAALYVVGQRVINTGIISLLAVASYGYYLKQQYCKS